MRTLRAAPVVTALAWLGFFVARYGPTGRGAGAGKIVFIAFAVAVTLALASGAYNQTRALVWLRSLRHRRKIDWSAFDETRARWERHRR